MEETTITSRIGYLMAMKGENTNSLARKLGMNQMTVHNYMNGREPSYTFLVNLLKLYRNLSAAWLMLGEGEMECGRAAANEIVIDTMNGGNAVAGTANIDTTDYAALLKEKDERIAELKSDKEQLKMLVEMLTRK